MIRSFCRPLRASGPGRNSGRGISGRGISGRGIASPGGVAAGILLAALVVSPLSVLPSPARAESGLLQGGDGPLEVLADQGIEWQQGENRFIARGNAVASRGTSSLHADVLIAWYRPKGGTGETAGTAAGGAAGGGMAGMGGGTDLTRIEAHGSVRVQSPQQTASGTDAVYDLVSGKVTLTSSAGPVRLVTPKETLVARDGLDYDVNARVATARGNATLTQNGRTLKADTLVAHMGQGGSNELETVDALGTVTITTDKETARGSKGHYDARTGIATLSGSVTITRGESILTGGLATVNMKTGISTLTSDGSSSGGRARAVLVPERKGQGQ